MELSDEPTTAHDDAIETQPTGDAPDAAGMRAAFSGLDDGGRSPDPTVCPFFRREVDGELFPPLHNPDDENRCAAIGVPKPQSMRQQELVCLKAAHAECPRYLRGALAPPVPPPARRPATVPRATLAALLILVLSAGISFGFVVQRGGIELPVVEGAPSASAVAIVATPSPEVTAAPASVATLAPSPSLVASPSPSPSPTASPSPTPSPTPEPTASPTPTPKATPKATPKSDRYALLTKCTDRDGCWIYRVRSGDNLFSIAHYFGHSLATIYKWNPQYPGTALKVGAAIRMPPPTR